MSVNLGLYVIKRWSETGLLIAADLGNDQCDRDYTYRGYILYNLGNDDRDTNHIIQTLSMKFYRKLIFML